MNDRQILMVFEVGRIRGPGAAPVGDGEASAFEMGRVAPFALSAVRKKNLHFPAIRMVGTEGRPDIEGFRNRTVRAGAFPDRSLRIVPDQYAHPRHGCAASSDRQLPTEPRDGSADSKRFRQSFTAQVFRLIRHAISSFLDSSVAIGAGGIQRGCQSLLNCAPAWKDFVWPSVKRKLAVFT